MESAIHILAAIGSSLKASPCKCFLAGQATRLCVHPLVNIDCFSFLIIKTALTIVIIFIEGIIKITGIPRTLSLNNLVNPALWN